MDYFQQTQFLFMGYGLNDWNFRVVLRKLRAIFPTATGVAYPAQQSGPSWAIQHRPSPLETKLWESRGVKIFDMRINDFVAKLSATEAARGDGS